MAEGCEERLDFKFLKWVWEYPEKQKPKILEKLHKLSHEKEIIILNSPKAVRQFLKEMRSLNSLGMI